MSHAQRIIEKIRNIFFRRVKKQGGILVNPISAASFHISPFHRFCLFFLFYKFNVCPSNCLHFVLSQFCLTSFIIKFRVLSVKQFSFLKEQFFDTSEQFNQMSFFIFSAIIQITRYENTDSERRHFYEILYNFPKRP